MKRVITAFAPATVANVAVGFDILGFPLTLVGDWVTVARVPKPGVTIEAITGVADPLPMQPERNTATVGLLRLAQDLKLNHGFRVSIKKGIPLGSGMGGSAASSVGGLVAANALLDQPLPRERLLKYALMGEAAASGASHPDNVTPCLLGGLTLTQSVEPAEVVRVPVPEQILCVLVHPQINLETRRSRAVLKPEIPLSQLSRQSALLGGFLAGCFTRDLERIRKSLHDVIIEPQRAGLIPGFDRVQATARDCGALGCSISGSGPSVFAWVHSPAIAETVRAGMVEAFHRSGITTVDSWISPVSSEGARII